MPRRLTVETFTRRLEEAQARMQELCHRWTLLLPEAESASTEAADEIRAAIGQADLLVRKKLIKVSSGCVDCRQYPSHHNPRQPVLFLSLSSPACPPLQFMDLCLSAGNPGSTTTMEDLEGYWEACVAPPIAEVDGRFEKCDDLKRREWNPVAQPEPTAPKKSRTIKAAVRKSTRARKISTTAESGSAESGAQEEAQPRRSARAFMNAARERQRQLQAQAASQPEAQASAQADIFIAMPIKRQAGGGDADGGEDDDEPLARRVHAKRVSFGGMVVAHGKSLFTPVHAAAVEHHEPAPSAQRQITLTPVRRSTRQVCQLCWTDEVPVRFERKPHACLSSQFIFGLDRHPANSGWILLMRKKPSECWVQQRFMCCPTRPCKCAAARIYR